MVKTILEIESIWDPSGKATTANVQTCQSYFSIHEMIYFFNVSSKAIIKNAFSVNNMVLNCRNRVHLFHSFLPHNRVISYRYSNVGWAIKVKLHEPMSTTYNGILTMLLPFQ